MTLVRLRELVTRLGISHHHIRPLVHELAARLVKRQAAARNRDPDTADLLGQPSWRHEADAGGRLSLAVHNEEQPTVLDGQGGKVSSECLGQTAAGLRQHPESAEPTLGKSRATQHLERARYARQRCDVLGERDAPELPREDVVRRERERAADLEMTVED